MSFAWDGSPGDRIVLAEGIACVKGVSNDHLGTAKRAERGQQ